MGDGFHIIIKAKLAQVLLDRAWVETLETGQQIKPWPWADTWPVARMILPPLSEEVIILESTSGQALAFGPGRMTHMADFGKPGLTVVAAHNDTHFDDLDQLAFGQIILVETSDGQTHRYKVTGHEIIDTRQSVYLNTVLGSHLILSTCYPFGVSINQTPFRYLVYARWLGSTS